MKKYFMQGTADELHFGDVIELDVTKSLPSGKVRHHHLECKFLPELLPLLLEEGIIEEKEIEEKKPAAASYANATLIEELLSVLNALKTCTGKLSGIIDTLAPPVTGTNCKGNAKKADRK